MKYGPYLSGDGWKIGFSAWYFGPCLGLGKNQVPEPDYFNQHPTYITYIQTYFDEDNVYISILYDDIAPIQNGVYVDPFFGLFNK